MPLPTVSLPVLPPDQSKRLTPTDVTQFVRLEQCERFLRFRLAERAGQDFMTKYDVTPQRITPLLSQSGHEFEQEIEKRLTQHFPNLVNYADKYSKAHNRPSNNAEVLDEIRKLGPGQANVLSQPRLDVELHGWRLRGDLDLLRLERDAAGDLQVFIGDLKATAEVKVEHRLQVAFYRLMLEKLFQDNGIPHQPITMGVLYSPPVDPPKELDQTQVETLQALLKLDDARLEIISEPEAYLQSVHDLVLNADSTARRVAEMPFEEVAYSLSFKCDGCLYNEFCMKWSAEADDLSLLPYMTGTDKQALRRAGVTTIKELATLKEFVLSTKELVPAAGREPQIKQIAATWSVGPRLDELIHRARSFRRSVRKDDLSALSYIPGKGNSTLPVSTPDLNPNLVWVYLDAQPDYLEERVYLLGAMVVACRNGEPVARRAVVRMTEMPPSSASVEQDLFVTWTRDLVEAVVDLAVSGADDGQPKAAPIHVVFFDRYEQKVMLEGLARNFPPMVHRTPPLYDFLTQIAAFDSPIASFLDEELRTFKNLPMTCQSLQSVAQYMKFDWNTPQKFREMFKARLFDNIGKLELDGQSEWFTKRSRFGSTIPLEYAYAAWGELPFPGADRHDPFADFRTVTAEQIVAFQQRRLEAMSHVAGTFQGNKNTQKTPFVLPDLTHYDTKAESLAQALHEFVTIERLVELNDWKTTRHDPPERRVLMGDCLIIKYVEEDQEPGIAEQNRENERRRLKREELAAAFKAANPGKQFRLNKEQSAECKWSAEGLRLKLRIETEGVDCDLHEALLMSNLRVGDRLVLFRRLTVDERLPPEQQTPFTPTPKQMLYGQRAELIGFRTEVDPSGRVLSAMVEIELKDSRGSDATKPHVFPAFNRPLEAGETYTLDPCPNDWYGYWLMQVVSGLCDGQPNNMYRRLTQDTVLGKDAGLLGQTAFLAGLDAFRKAGHLHDFEEGKRKFIGEYGCSPLLLVQGPPGTGKSYSTAFAVFARLQAAMVENRPYRVFLSCKTHAATDVLLTNVLDVQNKLSELHAHDPALFAQHFDIRLLEVPLYRVAPNDQPPPGVIELQKDAEKESGEEKNVDLIQEHTWAVIAVTPGGTYSMLKQKWSKCVFGHELCDLLVLDEASQMNLPEALMAALPLKEDAPVIVVGDHRQMPPIVKHDWENETRRTFDQYAAYESLFDTLRSKNPPMIRFAESFRLHSAMAEFLRQEVYRHDGINYHSKKTTTLAARTDLDDFVTAVLHPDHPLVVVVHDEAGSQVRNPYEQSLIHPLLKALSDPARYGLGAAEGLGIVVPHRAQRAALQQAFPELCILDPNSGLPTRSAIDTVERFQGGERTVILVSATESDRAYLLASSTFLLDPRRLTVAVSRAKQKMILVASHSIFSLFSPDEETFANALLWKNILKTCSTRLWSGERDGLPVAVWGRSGDC